MIRIKKIKTKFEKSKRFTTKDHEEVAKNFRRVMTKYGFKHELDSYNMELKNKEVDNEEEAKEDYS